MNWNKTSGSSEKRRSFNHLHSKLNYETLITCDHQQLSNSWIIRDEPHPKTITKGISSEQLSQCYFSFSLPFLYTYLQIVCVSVSVYAVNGMIRRRESNTLPHQPYNFLSFATKGCQPQFQESLFTFSSFLVSFVSKFELEKFQICPGFVSFKLFSVPVFSTLLNWKPTDTMIS